MIKVKGDGRFGPMIYMETDMCVGSSVELYGESDYYAINLLAQLLQEDDVVVDVGSNIGIFVVPLARLVPKGYVVSFEAQPIIFNILCGNVAINNLFNVTTAQRSVGNNDGQPLYVPLMDYSKRTKYSDVRLLENRDCPTDQVAHMIKVDSLNLGKLKILRISASAAPKGKELEILEGARQTIKRTKPIVYINVTQDSRGQIESWLEKVGYKSRRHDYPYFNKDNHAKSKQDVLQGVSENLFCYPSESESSLSSLFNDEFFKENTNNNVVQSATNSTCPFAPKRDLSVESAESTEVSELMLELPKIYANEEV